MYINVVHGAAKLLNSFGRNRNESTEKTIGNYSYTKIKDTTQILNFCSSHLSIWPKGEASSLSFGVGWIVQCQCPVSVCCRAIANGIHQQLLKSSAFTFIPWITFIYSMDHFVCVVFSIFRRHCHPLMFQNLIRECSA